MMKGDRKRNLFFVTVFLFTLILACLGQSLVEKLSIPAEKQVQLNLLPSEENQGSGEDTDDADQVVNNAKHVSADGDITDFLLPDFNKSQDTSTAKTKTYHVKKTTKILLYHTHTTEAYRPDGNDTYKASGYSRTNDTNKNIVSVGEELKKELESYGFEVIHDTTNHEPPKLATSYSRSIKTIEAYKEKYPEVDIFIDLHRDAANIETVQNDVVTVDGERCARVMFVVGKGLNYDIKPDWQANYQLANSICAQLNAINSKFTRPIRVKEPGRYNQHVSDMCMLIEIGHNANTLQEAKNSTKYIAKAISEVILLDG